MTQQREPVMPSDRRLFAEALDQLYRIHYHEAGHAVVAYADGTTVTGITISDDGTTGRANYRHTAYDNVGTVPFAGYIAERFHNPKNRGLALDGAREDFNPAEIARYKTEFRIAWKTVRERWRAIEAVVEELSNGVELDAQGFAMVVAWAEGPAIADRLDDVRDLLASRSGYEDLRKLFAEASAKIREASEEETTKWGMKRMAVKLEAAIDRLHGVEFEGVFSWDVRSDIFSAARAMRAMQKSGV